MLKGQPAQASTSPIDAPVSFFSSQVHRRPSDDNESLSISPNAPVTPHTLLFHRSTDMLCPEHEASSPIESSSWSSGSKLCGSHDSNETAPTSCEENSPELKADTESNYSVATITNEERLGIINSLLSSYHLQGMKVRGRQRSRSDVGLRSDSWCEFRGLPSSVEESKSPSPSKNTSSLRQESRTAANSPLASPTLASSPTVRLHPFDKLDFSAYVSGIGEPIDPDIEPSTKVQWQAFRNHARSRSLHRFDTRHSRSMLHGHQGRLEEHLENRLGLSPRRWTTSPRPPLSLMRDTELIPALKDLGKPVCEPGYVLHRKQEALSDAPPDAQPPASPVLVTKPDALDDIPDMEMAQEARGMSTPKPKPAKLSDADEQGFRTVLPRRRKQREPVHPRVLRSEAEEPVPPSLDAFADPEADDADEGEEMRGRSRSRGRGRRPSVQTSKPVGSMISPSKSSALGVSHRRPTLQRRHTNISYASAAALKSSQEDQVMEPLTRGRTRDRGRGRSHHVDGGSDDTEMRRGRREAVKVIPTSQDGAATVESEIRDTTSSSAAGESQVLEDSQALQRSRLLSNGAHLLMLSLELAMIRHHKINSPLKPRWGKRREDDFRPIPSIEDRARQFLQKQPTLDKQALPSTRASLYQYVDDLGSRLKYGVSAPSL